MVSTSSIFRLSLAGLALFSSVASSSRAGFVIRDLGAITTPGTSGACAISSTGQAAGFAMNASNVELAVYNTGFGSAFQTVGVPPEAQSSMATGINQNGTVAGYYTDLMGINHGFVATTGAPPVTISPLMVNGVAGGSTQLNGINNAGMAVGTGSLPSGVQAAFRASGTGSPLVIPSLITGGFNVGNGINKDGTVIGSSETASGYTHAFTQTTNGTSVDLSQMVSPGGFSFNTFGTAISSSGGVAGYGDIQQYEHAFFAVAPGVLPEDLGVVAGEGNGSSVQGTSSYAYGVNAQSFVVGKLDLGGSSTSAFLWSELQGMVDLNSLISPIDQSSWKLLTASAINDGNQIAGQGYFHGVLHGYELAPDSSGSIFGPAVTVPAPPTLVLSVIGCGIVAAWSRLSRKRTSKTETGGFYRQDV